jgi:hypothetical protein
MKEKRRDVLIDRILDGISRPLGKVYEPGPTWRALVKLFTKLDFVDSDEVWMGAEAAFGWMPGMLYDVHNLGEIQKLAREIRKKIGRLKIDEGQGFDKKLGERALQILEQADDTTPYLLTSLEIQRGAAERNYSVVGTSKFLHFLAPSTIPIFDSRVAGTLNKSGFTTENYLEYVSAVHKVAEQIQEKRGASIPAEIRQALRKSNAGSPVPIVREIEYTLYHRS